MEFLHPIAGYLTLLALPIILFYILKVRLRQTKVSTTLFWQQVFEERRTRSIWRRLRHLLSLLINLLFLSLLILTVLNPILSSQKKGVKTVVVIDNSASMNAIDSGNTTRLDLAISELFAYLAGTEVSRQTAIITAGGAPRVVLGFTNHLGTLRKIAGEIQTTDYPTEIGKAVELARHLIADHEDSEICVYTDGCSNEQEKFLTEKNIRFFPIGRPLENVAITQFQPRRMINDAVGYEVLVELVNYGKKTLECRLEIELEENPVDVIPMKLEPGIPQQIIKKYTTDQGGVLKATIDHRDSFSLDNTAFAILPTRSVQKVILYGEEDFFLQHVLLSQPNTELKLVEECPAVVPEDTVLVIHRIVPMIIPHGNVLVIDPQNDSNFCTVGEPLQSPLVAHEEKESPLMKFVHLSNVFLPGARNLTPLQTESNNEDDAATFSVIASTPEESPLLLQWDTPENQLVILSAELKKGDLALRTAFPIMISNTLNMFRGNGGELERAFSTADAVTIAALQTANRLTVRSPSGAVQQFPVKSGFLSLGMLPECGIWEISSTESKLIQQIACNLVNSAESDLQRASESFYAQKHVGVIQHAANRPLWFWLILLALCFSTLEWYLYQRRWID